MTRGPRRRVLVLDRDDGVRAELGRLFEDDYDVSSFETTEAAVAALRSDTEFAFAVCEYDPQARAAATLLRLVGYRETQGRLRCAVTLTGARLEDVGTCACAVLAKPFSRNTLLCALRLQPNARAAATSRR